MALQNNGDLSSGNNLQNTFGQDWSKIYAAPLKIQPWTFDKDAYKYQNVTQNISNPLPVDNKNKGRFSLDSGNVNKFLNILSSKKGTYKQEEKINDPRTTVVQSSAAQPNPKQLAGVGSDGLLADTSKTPSSSGNNAKFTDSKFGQGAMAALPMVSAGIKSIGQKNGLVDENPTGLNQSINQGKDVVYGALQNSGFPITMAIGYGLQAIKDTGGELSATEHDDELSDEDNLSKGDNTRNLITSFATVGTGIGYFTKKTDKYDVSKELASSSGFSGLATDAQAAHNQFSGKKIGNGRKKANEILARMRSRDEQVKSILKDNQEAMSASNSFDLKYKNQISGGYDQRSSIRAGKEGLKIDSQPKDINNIKDKLDIIYSRRRTKKQEQFSIKSHNIQNNKREEPKTADISDQNIYTVIFSNDELEKFRVFSSLEVGKFFVSELEELLCKFKPKVDEYKDGGSINVIPGGKLHAHNHNMAEISEIYENVTSKGMPVVVYDENGLPEQTAEIETSEVIFRKELTDAIEKLRKSRDQKSEIEAGKLLAYELIKKTINYSHEYTDIHKTSKIKQNNEIHL